ncbi:unnamed protein product [Victoria cruziana]
MSEVTPEPVCAKEALELLNCVASASYGSDRCAALLESLRQCILKKNVKKFSLSGSNPSASSSAEKKTRP